MVAQVWQATTARATQPARRRRDAALVMDECQNFLHLPYSSRTSSPKPAAFAVSITLAHQTCASCPASCARDLRQRPQQDLLLRRAGRRPRPGPPHPPRTRRTRPRPTSTRFHAAARLSSRRRNPRLHPHHPPPPHPAAPRGAHPTPAPLRPAPLRPAPRGPRDPSPDRRRPAPDRGPARGPRSGELEQPARQRHAEPVDPQRDARRRRDRGHHVPAPERGQR